MTRRTRIVLVACSFACFLGVAAFDPFTGTPRPVVLAHLVVLLGQAYLLVQLIRAKPLPALTLERVSRFRRQNALGTIVGAGIGWVLALVWHGSDEPDRWVYLWLAVSLGLGAILSAVNVVRQSLALRRGEVPAGMRRRWDATSRRRTE